MNSSAQNEEVAADLFAADIFAARPSIDSEPASADAPVSWNEALPKVSSGAVDWSKLLNNLPPDFSAGFVDVLAISLSRLLDLPDENQIEFSFSVKREINQAEEFSVENENSLWLTIAIEETGAEINFRIDDAFAVRLVDAALGETDFEIGQIRRLTASETAVLEFLSLNIVFEANRFLQSPLFKFQSLSREIPASIRRNLESATVSLLVADWQIVHEILSAVVKIYFAPESLEALKAGENPLLDNRLRRRRSARVDPRNRTKNARLRLPCGTAELSLGELAAIEPGDVVLLESYDFAVGGGTIFGRAALFLGDGENAKIAGEFVGGNFDFGLRHTDDETNGDDKIPVRALNSKNEWQFVIEHFTDTENPFFSETSMTEPDDNFTNATGEENADGGQSGLAVENLVVTLRVELEARRLTVAEIENLRENQILELGVRPTDAVNLFVDNQQIGRGELVSIEDRLGVRVTKLLR